jgi:hypothetical protein
MSNNSARGEDVFHNASASGAIDFGAFDLEATPSG